MKYLWNIFITVGVVAANFFFVYCIFGKGWECAIFWAVFVPIILVGCYSALKKVEKK